MGRRLNQGIVYTLVDVVGILYWQALLMVIMIVPPITFVALKYWGVKTR